jgi:3-methyladenine DNA glycosylase AlkD
MKSDGGIGDTRRTLSICGRLAHDHHPMVAKALSWALRALVPHDRQSVARFLVQHNAELAPLVKREVLHKMQTGLKNPHRKRQE